MSARLVPPDYIVSPLKQTWSISPYDGAIDWVDSDQTAMMLKHLESVSVLLHQHLGGLPSLTAVLYIVGAASNGWMPQVATLRVEALLEGARIKKGSAAADAYMDIAQWLVSLGELPTEFRKTARAHAALLLELYEKLPAELLSVSQAQSEEVVQWLQFADGHSIGRLKNINRDEPAACALALNTLEFAMFRALDGEALRLRMLTGLDTLLEPDETELGLPERFPIAKLLQEIVKGNNHDLAELGSLAQSVSTTVALPRRPSDPDGLPIGGVSDVSNRGQPDQLLISELAADADMLIARIAHGQALYLRRESPPQPQVHRRRLLIESGVRSWGISRLYMAAFALAVCVSEERRGGPGLEITTVSGELAWPEDFESRAGLIEHFERLSASVHPGAAIVKTASQWQNDKDTVTEPLLIVTAASDRDPTFRSCLQQLPFPYLVARVDHEGWAELLLRTASGDTLVQRLNLQRTEPTSHEKSRPTDVTLKSPDRLPLLIMMGKDCPLLFTSNLAGPWSQVATRNNPPASESQKTVWTVTTDRRVLCYQARHVGARDTGSLPSTKILASHVDFFRSWVLIVERQDPTSKAIEHLLVHASLDREMEFIRLSMNGENPGKVTYWFDRGNLMRIGRHVAFFDLRTGQILAQAQRTMRHLGGPFFGDVEVHVCVREGQAISWDCLGRCPSKAGIAVRYGTNFPVVYAPDLSWKLDLTGDNPRPVETEKMVTASSFPRLLHVNEQGTEILVSIENVLRSHGLSLAQGLGKRNWLRLNLTNTDISLFHHSGLDDVFNWTRLEFANSHYPDTMSVRKKINAIGFLPGRVLLHTHNRWLEIDATKGLQAFSTDDYSVWRRFAFDEPIANPNGRYPCKWTLRRAKFLGGEAWLDSRGLLHLRSSQDNSELSLVLSDSIAGWHSSGHTFGNSYFTGNSTTSSHHHTTDLVAQWLKQFAERCA